MHVIVVDAANVVGSRPDGWWSDRAKAAAHLRADVAAAVDAGRLEPPVVLVLEGAARQGAAEARTDDVRVVHAPRNGDDTIAALVAEEIAAGHDVTVVTADRELRARVRRAGGDSVGPRWLLGRT